MKSISWSGLAVFALACTLTDRPAAAQSSKWDRTISVEVHAPYFKPNGKTWDLELPIFINEPFLGDPAPDMMLCVVDESGADACIHDSTNNRFGVPLSICQNRYVCNFTNVKSPSEGYFGFLIIDLDELPSKHDYMLGAVLRSGPEDSRRASAIAGKLRTLAAKWNAVGVPDAFPEAEVADCGLSNPCFGNMRGGIPSVSIIDALDAELDECSMPILGELTVGPRTQVWSADLQFRITE